MDITRITLNGKEYQIKDADAQIVVNQLLNRIKELENKTADVVELTNFNEDNIFVGAMDETDKDKPITYEYLTSLLAKDNTNNKVFANTDKPIKVRHKWLAIGDEPNKTFFILVPATHKGLYSFSGGCQSFNGWQDSYTTVSIDFPSGSRKQYKLFRFVNWLVRWDGEITYTF